MSNQIAPPVPAMPPVSSIQDPAVRRALQSLIDAHNTRNGVTPQRFLTAADLDQLAGRIVFMGLSSGTLGGGVGGPPQQGGGASQSIESIVFGSRLWQNLSANIEFLTAENNLSVARIRSLGDGFLTERIERIEQGSALLTQIDAMSVTVGASQAAILNEQTVRATNETALVQAINTMFAAVGNNNALIQSGGNIATNWTGSQIDMWSQLQAEVFTAGGKTIRQALATETQLISNQVTGLYAQYTVKIDQNGYVSGFGLASEAPIDGTPSSMFIVLADKFAVVTPGENPQIPFFIGPSGLHFEGATDWAGVVGGAKPADGATKNNIFRQATQPISGMGVGDFWVKTSTPIALYQYNGTSWVQVGDRTSENTAQAIAGQGAFATLNQITASNISTYIANAVITSAYIGSAAITTAKIEDLAVEGAKIANLAVGAAKIANAAIGTAKIGDAVITRAKIGELEVGGNKIGPPTTGAVALGGGASAVIGTGLARAALATITSISTAPGFNRVAKASISSSAGSVTVTNQSYVDTESGETPVSATVGYAYL